MTTQILLYLGITLFVSLLASLLHMLLRQLKRKIDVQVVENGKPSYVSATVRQDDGKVAEVFLPAGTSQKTIGRVSIDKTGEKAIVQLLSSDFDDDSVDPIFKRYGYIGTDGFIYSQKEKKGPVERVGYVARPSKPDVPCMKGERSWKTLWLHSYLNVYRFKKSISDVAPVVRNSIDPSSVMSMPVSSVRRDQTGLSRAEIINDIKNHMVLVEGGSFRMGADQDEKRSIVEDGKERGQVEVNESPAHDVTLSSYYISRFPVTQAEWKAITGENPSECTDDPNYPVAPVSWIECQKFISMLNDATGLTFSMPTEAQWEYAARGGKSTNRTYFSGSNIFTEVGWNDYKHPVGAKMPNELGLYDMSGLVREWCSDYWGHYSEEPAVDPVGPAEDSPLIIRNTTGDLCHVVRSPSGNETVTNRKGEAPMLDKQFKSYGLRLVCKTMKQTAPSYGNLVTPGEDANNTADVDTLATVQQKVEETPAIEPAMAPIIPAAETVPISQPVMETSESSFEPADSQPQATDVQPVEPQLRAADVQPVKQQPQQEVKLSEMAELVARCDCQGSGFPVVNNITTIARAGAYALFARDHKVNAYDEYYGEAKHGWADTALLASFVYTILYFLYYLVNTSILQRPLVGMFGWGIPVLYGFYYVIWALIRSIKIERADAGDTIQNQIDLFNKKLGQKAYDICVLALGSVAIPLSTIVFDYDFIPLITAIMTGFTINGFVRDVSKPWRVVKSYSELRNEALDDPNNEDEYVPEGDIINSYDWDLDWEGKPLHGNISVAFDSDLIKEERCNNPFFSQTAIEPKDIAENVFHMLVNRKDYMARIKYVARQITKIAERADLTEYMKLQFALDFIQEPNIRFVHDKDSERIQCPIRYMRLPDETLLDKEGDYDCKTFLAAFLYYAMGYNVVMLYSSKFDHYAVAVEERYRWTESIWDDPEKKSVLNLEGHRYILCETTVDGFKIGDLLEGLSIDDFNTKIKFFHDSDNESEDVEMVTYDWDLDSEAGSKAVHGMVTLGFDLDYINALRKKNPFRTYGEDGNTYEQNVYSMVNFLKSNDQYLANVKSVAAVIRNKYPEASLESMQFALDFVQEPNIRYCIDEKSDSISFAKEYMRFPDETLYDRQGDCDCKSFLAAMLFGCLGHDSIILLSKEYSHAAVAVECEEDMLSAIENIDRSRSVIERDGKQFVYCETTGEGFRVGHIKDGESVTGFDQRIYITK